MQNGVVQILILVIVAITLPRMLVSFLSAVCAVNPNRGIRVDARHRNRQLLENGHESIALIG